jgi:hypothetical protein
MFILLWFALLLARSKFHIKSLDYAGFLETIGEIIVWSVLFLLCGAVIVMLSVALFRAINIDASDFYVENIVTLGLVASPFVSLLVIERFNKVKLSIIIANIFLPIIFITIIVFGVSSFLTETKPYEDRDIFILYNVMMVIVVCVLVFTSINTINNRFIAVCSYILPVVTIVLDIVTISAVIYRLNKYGITANKITLLGTNIMMLGHLLYIFFLKVKREGEKNVQYLFIYAIWAGIVVFAFPFIFNMK